MERKRLNNLAAQLNSTFLKTKNVTHQIYSQNENSAVPLPYRSWEEPISRKNTTSAVPSTSGKSKTSNLTDIESSRRTKEKHKLSIEERLNELEEAVYEMKTFVFGENRNKYEQLENNIRDFQEDLDMTKKAYIELIYFELSKSNVALKKKEMAKSGEDLLDSLDSKLRIASNIPSNTTISIAPDVTNKKYTEKLSGKINTRGVEKNSEQVTSSTRASTKHLNKKKKKKKTAPSKPSSSKAPFSGSHTFDVPPNSSQSDIIISDHNKNIPINKKSSKPQKWVGPSSKQL